jgi:hypothetical protein
MLRYFKDDRAVFDPDTVSLLCGALDDAWQVVKANKATFKVDGHAERARTALAKHIVEMAKNGERDRERLMRGALIELKLRFLGGADCRSAAGVSFSRLSPRISRSTLK